MSLRDYRPGDPLRRVHWRSYAKTGEPVVKEFQDEYFTRHALILDTFAVPGGDEAFEEAVSVAASFACTLLTQESLLDLLFLEKGLTAYDDLKRDSLAAMPFAKQAFLPDPTRASFRAQVFSNETARK